MKVTVGVTLFRAESDKFRTSSLLDGRLRRSDMDRFCGSGLACGIWFPFSISSSRPSLAGDMGGDGAAPTDKRVTNVVPRWLTDATLFLCVCFLCWYWAKSDLFMLLLHCVQKN